MPACQVRQELQARVAAQLFCCRLGHMPHEGSRTRRYTWNPTFGYLSSPEPEASWSLNDVLETSCRSGAALRRRSRASGSDRTAIAGPFRAVRRREDRVDHCLGSEAEGREGLRAEVHELITMLQQLDQQPGCLALC